MTPDLIASVVLSVIGYTMLLLTGVNGIRHARIMGIGWDGYLMSSIWLWLALTGSLNLVKSITLVTSYGRPVAILFTTGHLEPFTFGLSNWVVLSVGFVICVGLCFRSFVMVRNAKQMTKETRAEHAKTYAASLSLRATLKKDA